MTGKRSSMDGGRRDEFGMIAQYFAPLARLVGGAFEADPLNLIDDAALLAGREGQQLVLTKDMLVAGVHFFADDAPEFIAKKMLRVNLSDLAGMGAKPIAYMLGFGVPAEIDEGWIAAFASGLAEDQDMFGLGLLGGDSVAVPNDMTLSLTAIGSVEKGKVLKRSAAKAGDDIWVSGTIGDAALCLLAHQDKIEDQSGVLLQRYLLPEPRCALGETLQGLAHAAMDISDGLIADLGHMASASGLAMELDANSVPLSAATQTVIEGDPALLDVALTGGDDYELAFTAAPANRAMIEEAAHSAGVAVTRIGACSEGAGVQIRGHSDPQLLLGRSGYQHF